MPANRTRLDHPCQVRSLAGLRSYAKTVACSCFLVIAPGCRRASILMAAPWRTEPRRLEARLRSVEHLVGHLLQPSRYRTVVHTHKFRGPHPIGQTGDAISPAAGIRCRWGPGDWTPSRSRRGPGSPQGSAHIGRDHTNGPEAMPVAAKRGWPRYPTWLSHGCYHDGWSGRDMSAGIMGAEAIAGEGLRCPCIATFSRT
jgi:hypothetical protein